MQPELTNETFVGEFRLHFVSLLETLKSTARALRGLKIATSPQLGPCWAPLENPRGPKMVSPRYLSSVYHIGISCRYLITISHIGIISCRYLITVSHIGISYRHLMSGSQFSCRYLTSVSHIGISPWCLISVSQSC